MKCPHLQPHPAPSWRSARQCRVPRNPSMASDKDLPSLSLELLWRRGRCCKGSGVPPTSRDLEKLAEPGASPGLPCPISLQNKTQQVGGSTCRSQVAEDMTHLKSRDREELSYSLLPFQ